MAISHRDFTSYVIYYMSGGSPAVGVAQDAEIDCFTANGERAGSIYFFPDAVPLPANNQNVNGISLYYRQSRFSDVMTVLREEKPLNLHLDIDRKVGYMGTNAEPIGSKKACSDPRWAHSDLTRD